MGMGNNKPKGDGIELQGTAKRVIHVGVRANTFVNMDGIQSGLQLLCNLAEDAEDFKDILNQAILALFIGLPTYGRSYDEKQKHAYLGKIWLCSARAGNPTIEYTPALSLQDKCYSQQNLGSINLGQRSFHTYWIDYNAKHWGIPERVMRDTDTVMEKLGLTKE